MKKRVLVIHYLKKMMYVVFFHLSNTYFEEKYLWNWPVFFKICGQNRNRPLSLPFLLPLGLEKVRSLQKKQQKKTKNKWHVDILYPPQCQTVFGDKRPLVIDRPFVGCCLPGRAHSWFSSIFPMTTVRAFCVWIRW